MALVRVLPAVSICALVATVAPRSAQGLFFREFRNRFQDAMKKARELLTKFENSRKQQLEGYPVPPGEEKLPSPRNPEEAFVQAKRRLPNNAGALRAARQKMADAEEG